MQVIGNKQRMQENHGVLGVGATGSTAVNITGNIFVDAISVLQQPVDGGHGLRQPAPPERTVRRTGAVRHAGDPDLQSAGERHLNRADDVRRADDLGQAGDLRQLDDNTGDSRPVGGPQPPGHDGAGEQLPGRRRAWLSSQARRNNGGPASKVAQRRGGGDRGVPRGLGQQRHLTEVLAGPQLGELAPPRVTEAVPRG